MLQYNRSLRFFDHYDMRETLSVFASSPAREYDPGENDVAGDSEERDEREENALDPQIELGENGLYLKKR